MFDEYEILEYLLKKAYSRNRIPYGKIYNEFEVGLDEDDEDIPYEYKKSVENFLDAMERAEKAIVSELLPFDKDNVAPIYSVILYRNRDKLPGIGFYDIFKNRNYKFYREIAVNLDVQDAFKNEEIKKQIFHLAIKSLKGDCKINCVNPAVTS